MGNSKTKHPMHPADWERIKAIRLGARFIHISCDAKMIPNPVDHLLPKIPWIEKPGTTFMWDPSYKRYRKWRKTNSNLKWIKHLVEIPSEYEKGY